MFKLAATVLGCWSLTNFSLSRAHRTSYTYLYTLTVASLFLYVLLVLATVPGFSLLVSTLALLVLLALALETLTAVLTRV